MRIKGLIRMKGLGEGKRLVRIEGLDEEGKSLVKYISDYISRIF